MVTTPTAFSGQPRQELSRHPFPINDQPPERCLVRCGFISAGENLYWLYAFGLTQSIT
jgi:hypothetical protein